MSQTGSDAAAAQAPPKGLKPAAVRPPPLSPHLQVWRWHVTMAGSIATRASGIVLYAGALITAGLVWALALGQEAYAGYVGLLNSPVGYVVLFGVATALFYHLAAGVRHLVWDSGRGFQPRTADMSGLFCFGFGLVAAIALFAWAMMSGALG